MKICEISKTYFFIIYILCKLERYGVVLGFFKVHLLQLSTQGTAIKRRKEVKMNALNVITFICDLKNDIQLTEKEIELIESNNLLRFDLAKVITNFAFDQNCKSTEELKGCQNINELYPRVKSIINTYKN